MVQLANLLQAEEGRDGFFESYMNPFTYATIITINEYMQSPSGDYFANNLVAIGFILKSRWIITTQSKVAVY